MRNKTKKQMLLLVVGSALVGSLLTGCGSAAASTSGSGQNQQSGQSQNGQGHNGQHRGNFHFADQLTKAGLSQTDAQNLANLIRTKHVQPKWVLDQVNNKVPVSQITADINNGKAPTMQRGGNGKGNWSGKGGNGSNGSSNSGSSNGISN